MKFHPLADLFPLMQGAEFERFADDVEANGLHEAILVHQDGSIIDGRNRFRACEARHLEPRFRTYDGTDGEVLDFVLSANLVRRHLNESQRAVVAAKMATFGHGGDRSKTQICAMTQADAAEKLNVGRRSVQSAVVVLDKGTQGLIAAVETGGIAVSDASSIVDRPRADQDALLATVTGGEKKNLIAAVRAADIARQRAEIAAGNFTLPEGVFDCIVIDPPWPYGTQEQYDPVGFRVTTPYPEMGLDELAAIEIPAAEDCVLWLWTTHRFMPDAFPLLRAWGFEHKVILTWVKERFGVGRWLRSNTEFCILAVRGHPKVSLTNQKTSLEAPMRQHSRKPQEFYELVESLCIAERRLDFFSREKREGWEQLGNDADKFR